MQLRNVVMSAHDYVGQNDPRFAEYRRFNKESECVAYLYLRCLPTLVTDGIAKVIVAVTDDPELAKSRRVEDMIDVVRFPWPFDFQEYWKLDDHAKKRRTLDVLQEALLWFAKREGWDPEPLKTAYEEVLRRDFVNEGFMRRRGKSAWTSPDRRHKAKVFWTFGFENIQVFALIYDKSGNEIGRKLLVELDPHGYFLYHALGECRWRSKNVFVLKSRRGKETWTCNISRLR